LKIFFYPSNFNLLQESARQRRWNLVQSSGTRDDFDQLSGDDGLTGSVECQRELVNHLAGVLRRVVHGSHSRGLFRAGALLHGVEEHGSQGEFHVALDDVGVQGIVDGELGSALDGLQAVEWQLSDAVRHDRLELVVDDLAVGVFVLQVHDFVGQLGGVQERWWQATDLKWLCNER
jgi:hypothetical protein